MVYARSVKAQHKSGMTQIKTSVKEGKPVDEANARRFVTNLFAYPDGYFDQHTAEELHISEEDRLELIRLQNECTDSAHSEASAREQLKAFEEEFFA